MEPKDKEEEKKKGGLFSDFSAKSNKPIIPTLKDSAGKPQLKIKGLAQGGMSLIERLKQFKKKDLAFIMAGLGVLFMAPLAEHFMMAPEGQNGDLFGPGISSRGDGKVFGGPGNIYENGSGIGAPGGAIGQNGDVITPLNVRDPSALVMGPGATNQPPAGSPSAVTPPDKKESSDWKDALANSAATAAKAAVKHASLPVPKVPLGGGGLRGFGAISGGGSGGSFSAAPLSAAAVPNHPGGGGNMPGVRGGGNIKGVARGPGSGAGGGFDALRKAAAGQGDAMNRGAAGSSLDNAAKMAMGDGSAFGGASGESKGDGDKGPGGNAGKDSKSVGESLEFLRLKAEQDHAIDLEWKLKEKAAMRWPNLEDKILEEGIMTPWKKITEAIGKGVAGLGAVDGPMACNYDDGTGKPTGAAFTLNKGDIADNQSGCSQNAKDGTAGSGAYKDISGGLKECGSNKPLLCDGSKKAGDAPPKNKEDGVVKGARPPAAGGNSGSSNRQCEGYRKTISAGTSSKGAGVQAQPGEKETATSQAQAVAEINAANAGLDGTPANAADCGGVASPTKVNAGAGPNANQSVKALLTTVRNSIVGQTDGDYVASVLGILDDESKATDGVLVALTDGKGTGPLEKADTDFKAAQTKDARKAPADAETTALKNAQGDPSAKLKEKADKDKDLDAKIGAADEQLKTARKSLDEVAGLLKAARGDAAKIAVTPDPDNYYHKSKDAIKQDNDAADSVRKDLEDVYDAERAAVDALQKDLHPASGLTDKKGVNYEAKATQDIVKDGGDVKSMTDLAAQWAALPDPAADPGYAPKSATVLPALKALSNDRAVQYNGSQDGKQLGVSGAHDKFKNVASPGLNGETAPAAAASAVTTK